MFRAHDPGRDRLVAIKVFQLDITPEQSAALVRALERLIACDIAHPASAAPIAAGLDGDDAYLAMEYAVGNSLDVAARTGPAPLVEVVPSVDAIAAAIDRSAERGVRHGLLHPRDIVMSADGPRVTGFGIAEALSSIGITLPARRPYAAPEEPSDVYSLAAIAYELISGRRMTPTGWDELSAENGPELRAAFAAALSEDPHARPASAGEFAAMLRNAARAADQKAGPADGDIVEGERVAEFDSTHLDRFADLGAAPDLQMDLAPATPFPPSWTAQPPKPFQPEEPKPPSRGLKLAVLFLIVVAVFFAGRHALRSRASRPSDATPPAVAPPPVTATPVALPPAPAPAPTPSRPAAGVATEPPARAATEPGRLLVRSTPADATVTINGQPRGKTPLALRDLPLGSYTIHLALDGFAAEDRRLRLTAKRSGASLVVALRRTRSAKGSAPRELVKSRGSIAVQSRPSGARVFVNNRLVGSTPLATPDLPAGPATVRIEMDGYQTWTTAVRVKAGERTAVTASLDRK